MMVINFLAENSMVLLTAISVLILFYYTKETYLLRKEAQKQTQTQFTPYLSLRNLDEGATFSNLGKGIALHIKVDEEVMIDSGKILLIPSIGAGEDRQLFRMVREEKGASKIYANRLPDEIGVTYKDIMGNEYRAIFVREYQGFGVFKESSQYKIK